MAIACTPIETAKLNRIVSQARLAWIPAQITGHETARLDELTP